MKFHQIAAALSPFSPLLKKKSNGNGQQIPKNPRTKLAIVPDLAF
jgi:hypothetical protein